MKTNIISSWYVAIKASLIVAGITIIQCLSGNAVAAPVQYQYTTGANPYGGTGGASGYFASTSSVSGTFMYDSAAPQTNTAGTGAYIFSSYDSGGGVLSSSFTALTGAVQGFNFSDPRGRTRVASTEATSESEDFLALHAEPTLYSDLTGFAVGGYQLVNVRFFWLETTLGNGDFLADNSLPSVLPSLQGRLALDFVPVGTSPSTLNFNHSVFFDGLTVTPVPEPEIYAMMGLGLGLMGFVARRRKQQAA